MCIKTKKLFDKIHRSIISSSCDKVAKELGCYGDWKQGSYIRVSVTTIAKNTKLHERTVRRCLKILRGLGYITKVRPHSMYGKRPTEYQLNFKAILFSIEASVPLFQADNLKEFQRKVRKAQRRDDRQKQAIHFLFSESVDNIENSVEISEKTPGRMPGNNIAIDYCINTVGFNNSVDNFEDQGVAIKHIIDEDVLPCDIIGQPSQINLEVISALKTILTEKEGTPLFLEATRCLYNFESMRLAA